MEWVETTGKTVHDAREAALDVLGVHEDDAEFEVVSEARTGLFGRVKDDARVRARVRPTTPRAKDDRRRRRRGGKGKGGQNGQNGGESRDSKPAKKSPAKKAAKKSAAKNEGGRGGRSGQEQKQEKMSDEPTMPLEQQADIAEEFVAGLADRFGTSLSFTREQVADDEIRVTANGDGIGRMIGPRGGTAGAIDELVRTVLQRHAGSGRDGRIRIDMGGVRARRAEALAAFTRAQAEEVRTSGVPRALEPMNGADRKVVHDTIGDEDGVATTSEGEDPNRRVVIVPAGDAD